MKNDNDKVTEPNDGTENKDFELMFNNLHNSFEYINKTVQLTMLKDVIRANDLALKSKYEELQEEQRNLFLVQNEVQTLQDLACNDTWTFSKNHDFSSIIYKFPNVTADILCNCPTSIYKDRRKEIESIALQDPKVYELNIKIEELEKEVENTDQEETLKKKIKEANLELDSASQDDVDIKFWRKELERAKKELDIVHKKIEKAKIDYNFDINVENPLHKVDNEQSSFNDKNMETFIYNYFKPKTDMSVKLNNNIIKKSTQNGNYINLSDAQVSTNYIDDTKIVDNNLWTDPRTKNSDSNDIDLNFKMLENQANTDNINTNNILEDPSINELFANEFSILTKTSGEKSPNFTCTDKQLKSDVNLVISETNLPILQPNNKRKSNFVLKKQSNISRKLLKLSK